MAMGGDGVVRWGAGGDGGGGAGGGGGGCSWVAGVARAAAGRGGQCGGDGVGGGDRGDGDGGGGGGGDDDEGGDEGDEGGEGGEAEGRGEVWAACGEGGPMPAPYEAWLEPRHAGLRVRSGGKSRRSKPSDILQAASSLSIDRKLCAHSPTGAQTAQPMACQRHTRERGQRRWRCCR